jgi:hypothetical protein
MFNNAIVVRCMQSIRLQDSNTPCRHLECFGMLHSMAALERVNRSIQYAIKWDIMTWFLPFKNENPSTSMMVVMFGSKLGFNS